MVALALPWPRVSRPSARRTSRPADSSFSRKVALPLYWAVIGPDLDLDDAAVLLALDLLELGAGHARGDALDVGQDRPGLLGRHGDLGIRCQLHGPRSSTVSMSAGSPAHATAITSSGCPRSTRAGPLVALRRQQVPDRRPTAAPGCARRPW